MKIALASRDKELKTIELKYCFLREEKSKSDCMVNEK